MDKRMINWLDRYMTDPVSFINPDIKIDIDKGGRTFAPIKGIKGMVVFGRLYPLCGLDVSVEDHAKVLEAIDEAKRGINVHGTVHIQGQPLTISSDTTFLYETPDSHIYMTCEKSGLSFEPLNNEQPPFKI